MQFAMDKRSGTEITPSQAIKGRNYSCPTCGEPVFVRGGIIRIWHFAHRSGRADLNCENYHPGLVIGNPLIPEIENNANEVGGQLARIDPLALSLRVEALTDVARGILRQWRLILTIPKSLTAVGQLRVHTGFGSISKKLNLLSLIHSSQDVEVSPNSPGFGADWVSDEVDHDYRDVVLERLDGFAGDNVQAFAASAAEAKPQTSSLVWGDGYYILWKQVDFAIPKVLNARVLAPYEGWKAALITLPPFPIKEVADWLEASMKMRIQQGRRQWGILYPPPIEIDLDGNILVSESNFNIIGFVNTDEGEGECSKLTATVTNNQVSVEFRRSQMLQILRDALDVRSPLNLQWGSKHLPSIISPPVSDIVLTLPAIVLRVREAKDDSEQVYLFHRIEARQALDRIRRGDAELIEISIPRDVVGSLDQRLKRGQWQVALTLHQVSDGSQYGNSWSPSLLQLTLISNMIADVNSDFRMTFGVFGQYVALARIRDATVHTPLLSDTRRRIIWYCRANGISSDTCKRSLHLSPDTDLVEIFCASLPRPHLVAYRNFLQKKLPKLKSVRRTS